MKKIILGLSLLLIMLKVNGQTEKGNFLIGLSSYNIGHRVYVSGNSHQVYDWQSNLDTSYNTSSFEVNPYVGKFIEKDLAVGLKIPYEYQETKIGA